MEQINRNNMKLEGTSYASLNLRQAGIYPTAIEGVKETTTHYVRDAQGNTIATYEQKTYDNGNEELYLTEQHLYGSSRLGMRRMNVLLASTQGGAVANPNFAEASKNYELTNHLGNVLAVVSDTKKADGTANVVAAYDYYPFGSSMPGRVNEREEYRYGFGGHENDNEVSGNGNHLAFGDYGYDTRLGRRWNIDPQWENDLAQSPYSVNGNSPIQNTDPDGEWLMNVVGAVASAGLDYAGQVAGNLATGSGLTDALTKDISIGSILISAGEGAINPIGGTTKAAAKALAKTTATTVAKKTAQATAKKVATTTAKEAGKAAAAQVVDNTIEGEALGKDVLTNAAVGGVAGNVKFDAASKNTKANSTIKELKTTQTKKQNKGRDLTNRQQERLTEARNTRVSNIATEAVVTTTTTTNNTIGTNLIEKEKEKPEIRIIPSSSRGR
ncbi:MAG: hypothetical protein LBR81_04175 [Prevotellaceae bacterium]|jgi:hypothetical protein|nr:hypothetical protein [Prevotellaceae bacterium]